MPWEGQVRPTLDERPIGGVLAGLKTLDRRAPGLGQHGPKGVREPEWSFREPHLFAVPQLN